jgi:outer membrane protein assembly factor BamB
MAYDAATLDQKAIWCDTPTASGAGIFQAGQGPAADDQGNIYVLTGAGRFGRDSDAASTELNDGGMNFGQSVVQHSAKDLKVKGFFARGLQEQASTANADLGSAGPLLAGVQGKTWLIAGGRGGQLLVLDAANLGGFNTPPAGTLTLIGDPPPGSQPAEPRNIQAAPVLSGSRERTQLYTWGDLDLLRSVSMQATGQPNASDAKQSRVRAGGRPGGMLSISSGGDEDGIIWATVPLRGDASKQRLVDGVLRALDATTLEEIWNSEAATDGSDRPGHISSFTPPTVANGHVYVNTYDGKCVVYGLK